MNRLILVKHSSPQIEKHTPARKWKLSTEGKVRAERLAEVLATYQPVKVYSSAESKARETAGIIAGKLGLSYQVADNLHEHDRRFTPYVSVAEFQSLARRLFENPDQQVFGEETGSQALRRFRAGIENLTKHEATGALVIVSHGTVISLYVEWLTGCDGYTLWKELGLPSYIVIDPQHKTIDHIGNL